MELKVKVDRVFFPQEGVESDWMIIGTDKGTIKGSLSWRPEANELLILEGTFGMYQGRKEFKFTSARADVPIDPRDQLRYVCEMTTGFGLAMETKIWEAWGESWIDDVEPGIIKGLTGRKYDMLLASLSDFQLKREKAEAITWLMSKDATVNMATAAWDAWGKHAIGIVKSDCYRLAELPNYGFANVDKSVRHNFGITDTDPRRIKAGVMYAIKQQTDTGSTLVNWPILKDKIFQVIGGMHNALVCECIREMFNDGALKSFPETKEMAIMRDFENAEIIKEYVG